MEAGINKCGLMCSNDQEHNRLKASPLKLGDKPLPVVDDYQYLGVLY